jgi:hypothetical protein
MRKEHRRAVCGNAIHVRAHHKGTGTSHAATTICVATLARGPALNAGARSKFYGGRV